MKILEIYPYPPVVGENIPKLPGNFGTGGGEVYSYKISQGVADLGHEVTYITGKFPGIVKNPLQVGSLKMVYIPIRVPRGFVQYAYSFVLPFKVLFSKFDVINVWQFPTAFTLLSGIPSQFKGKKMLVSHVGLTPDISRSTRLFTKFNKLMTHKIVLLSKYGARYYEKYFPESKLHVIYPGIDVNFFKRTENKDLERKYKNEDEKILLYVGRLIPSKGIDLIVRSVKALNDKGIKAKAILIGSGPFREYLEKLAAELKITDKVIFTGYVPDDLMPAFYSFADVFVFPCVYHDALGGYNPEPGGFGLVLAEAMACKTVTVSSAVDVIPEWVKDGYNGIVVEPGNIQQLVDRLEQVLQDDNLRKKIIENAFNEVHEKYSLQIAARNYEKLYQESV